MLTIDQFVTIVPLRLKVYENGHGMEDETMTPLWRHPPGTRFCDDLGSAEGFRTAEAFHRLKAAFVTR
jgi:hypothetical protein